jgi:hypothetical protein
LALYRIFLLNSQLGKREFANLYYKGVSIIYIIKFLQFKASNLAQPKRSSRSQHDAGTFKARNSTKHDGKRFKPNTYAYLSKIKDEHTSKGRKSIARDKNLKDTFI